MNIKFLIFDKLTALDAVGPYEVLSRLPGSEVEFLAKEAGPKPTDTGMLSLVAARAFSEVDPADVDILLIPGGEGNRPMLSDEETLEWVREVHAGSEWTTSVCTGAMVLGAAGVLEGLSATTHWAHMEGLAKYGATPTSERVVREGKVFTAAGVSSGIDMALTLVAEMTGPKVAQAIQLGIEYDPEPPFDAGSPEKSDPAIVEFIRNLEGQPA